MDEQAQTQVLCAQRATFPDFVASAYEPVDRQDSNETRSPRRSSRPMLEIDWCPDV